MTNNKHKPRVSDAKFNDLRAASDAMDAAVAEQIRDFDKPHVSDEELAKWLDDFEDNPDRVLVDIEDEEFEFLLLDLRDAREENAALQRRLNQAGVQEPIRIESVDLGDGRKLVPKEGDAVEFPLVLRGGQFSSFLCNGSWHGSKADCIEQIEGSVAREWEWLSRDESQSRHEGEGASRRDMLDTWKVEDA